MRAIPGIPVTYGPPGQLICECSKEHPAVMGLFVRYTNLDARFASAVPRRYRLRAAAGPRAALARGPCPAADVPGRTAANLRPCAGTGRGRRAGRRAWPVSLTQRRGAGA